MWIDTQAASEREPRPRGGLNHFYGASLPGFLWPVTLLGRVLSLDSVHPGVLPCVPGHLGAKRDSRKEAMDRLASLPF